MKLLLSCIFLMTAIIASAQTGSVSGKVVDESNLPLPGASVSIKGTSKSTATDVNGNYKLSALDAGNITLTVSFMGYVASEKLVTVSNAGTKLDFKLQPSSQSLSEVIVVGYGTQTRREVTGSIAKVNAAKIVSLPTPSFEASLQGRAAGVQVIQGSGIAGSGSVVRIRGASSISAGGDPLYVVDGIPITQDPFLNGNRGGMNQNPLAAINPNDIESIEILKDAGAAGIYGSRGANGVVLITTKRGKAGKPQFNFSSKLGLSSFAVKPEFVNGQEWLQLRQEAWENDGNTGLATLPNGITWNNARNTNTNWWDLMTQTGSLSDLNLSVSGGKEKFKYYVNATSSKEESYLKGNSYGRIGFTGNLDWTITPKLKLGLASRWNQGTNNRVFAAWSGGIGDAMSVALPIYPVNNEDGTYWKNGANPVRQAESTEWRTLDTRSISNASLDFKPTKNLSFRVTGGLDYEDITEDQYTAAEFRGSTNGLAQRWPSWVTNYNTSATATYNLEINKENKVTFLAGTEFQKSETKKYNNISLDSTLVNGQIYDNPDYLNQSNTVRNIPNNNPNVDPSDRLISDRFTFLSYFGRINYNLKDKYFLTALARVDGSSKFGKNNQYGFFPAVSVAWLLTEEQFLKDVNFLSLLKIRAGYGITGNASIPTGEWYGKFAPRGSDRYNGQEITYPLNLENPDLKWETLKNLDLALEYGFLNNRINGEIGYYNKLSSDILVKRSNSPSSGFSDFWQNVGKIRNEGLEFSINTKNIAGKNFQWNTSFNITKNFNKVEDLGDLTPDAIGGGTNDTRIVEGYPVGTNYLVKYYGVDPNDGLPIWLDKSGYQTKTFSLDNRTIVGSVIPDATGGLENTFSYKGFSLSSLFVFTIGGNIYDGSGKRQLGIVTDWNIRSDIADRWRQPGDIAKYPKLTMNTANYPGLSSEWQYNSTMFLHDASYLRLRELTLGYNIPSKIASKMRLSNARVFLTGMNLLTFSKYPGGDPEIARDFENAQDRNMSPNVTYLTVPQQKAFTLGLNFKF